MKQAHNCGFLIDTVHYSLSLGKVNNKSLCVCMFVYLGWLNDHIVDSSQNCR